MYKKLILFFFIMFIIGTDTFIVSPLLPTLRMTLHMSIEQSGWIVMAYALGYALFALVAGPLSDRMDRKRVLIVGLISFSIFTFLCGTATKFFTLFTYRFLAGVSASFAAPQVWATIPKIVPPTQILKAMGIATAGLSVSQVLGVPIGSFLAKESWRDPFFCIGLMAFILILWVHFALPSIPSMLQESNRISIFNPYRRLLRHMGAKQVFFAHFFYNLGIFSAFSMLGLYLADRFHLSVDQIGMFILCFGIGNTLGSLFGNQIIGKLGRQNTFSFSLSTIGFLYVTLPFYNNLILVTVSITIIAFAGGIVFPLIMSRMQSIDQELRGTIASLGNSVMYGATTTGSFLASMIYAHMGSFVGIGVFVTFCMGISLLLFRMSNLDIKLKNKICLKNSTCVHME